jgi:hypothetical protein
VVARGVVARGVVDTGVVDTGVVDGGVVSRGVVSRNPMAGSLMTKLSLPSMPLEWLDSGSWRLPSGKALAEFALQAGFLAPLLFRADRFGKSAFHRSPAMSGPGEAGGNAAAERGKPFGKSEGR